MEQLTIWNYLVIFCVLAVLVGFPWAWLAIRNLRTRLTAVESRVSTIESHVKAVESHVKVVDSKRGMIR